MPDGDVQYVDLPVYRDELAQALHFTPPDLKANRLGRLGVNQGAVLLGAVARAAAVSVILAIVAAACVWAGVAMGPTSAIGFGALVVAACCAGWIAINAWYLIPVWRDVKAGIVSTAEGFVKGAERETDVRSGSFASVAVWSYYWTVDERQRFWVSGKAYATLTPARHRLYFLPMSRRIVAAEPIRTAAASTRPERAASTGSTA